MVNQIIITKEILDKLNKDKKIFAAVYGGTWSYSDVLYQWLKIMRLSEDKIKLQSYKLGGFYAKKDDK